MKSLISLVLILVGTSSFAATGSGNISSVTTLGSVGVTGGINIPNSNPDGYFSIYGAVGAPSSSERHYKLYKNGAEYQVTVGKTFVATAICASSSAATQIYQLFNATASITNDSATVTGGLYMGGANANHVLISDVTIGGLRCYNFPFSSAASTYVGYTVGSTSAYKILIVGKEI